VTFKTLKTSVVSVMLKPLKTEAQPHKLVVRQIFQGASEHGQAQPNQHFFLAKQLKSPVQAADFRLFRGICGFILRLPDKRFLKQNS
jgi:hypothetical protein